MLAEDAEDVAVVVVRVLLTDAANANVLGLRCEIHGRAFSSGGFEKGTEKELLFIL